MHKQRHWFSTILLRGVSIIVPVAVAFKVLEWLMSSAEAMVMTLAVNVFPWEWYVPGMGLILLVTAVFLVGLLMYPWASRQLDRLLRNIPVFSAVYSPVRDLMEIVGEAGSSDRGQPVILTLPGTETKTVAFITRRTSRNLPEELIQEDHVAVYVQLASQLGGVCLIVPESACKPLNLPAEDAMRFALTAGLSGPVAKRARCDSTTTNLREARSGDPADPVTTASGMQY